MPAAGIRVAAVMPADVAGEEPLHKLSHPALLAGPEHEVHMVRHQARGQHPRPGARGSLAEKLQERRVIVRIVEHLLPAVATVEGVVNCPSLVAAVAAWHGPKRTGQEPARSRVK